MQDFIKAVFAGFMIGIAALVSIGAGGSYVGAILFSIGLVIIVLCDYNLYTGKIGYITSLKEIPKYLKYILGNFIGVYIISLTTSINSPEIINAKMSAPLLLVFAKSVGCGFLMFIAVNSYKKHKSLLGTMGCVAAFLLAAYEHSIADMFYMCLGKSYNIQTLVFLSIVILGNALGALLHKLISY